MTSPSSLPFSSLASETVVALWCLAALRGAFKQVPTQEVPCNLMDAVQITHHSVQLWCIDLKAQLGVLSSPCSLTNA